MKITELQMKDVIAMETGERLGYISDLDIDTQRGRLKGLVLTMKGKAMGLFGKEEEMTIPWDQIVNIGADVILVKKNGYKSISTVQKTESDE
ncbi:YlmC/YmxH family sporulation protein [Halobacillus litoralis]|uniref:YlmC/YmxH family sporulation protein n=4 Tax=Halobacillus TaxID=45667 RepID=A0A845FB92_9BACI|nr:MULTISPECIES: YlmC/YmxH family sporulation protein [Halobacillus]MBN9652767.1 YlmC/YmxH family sporulation protein [Halobacillus sp. GSS1]MBX0356527.1 YlmC/YmxH family sporulation protein [Halobacillus sp. Nhm2S1]MYL48786.1 YlmC/YmxH family sporulation protein [Halobacillus litoralis]MYL70885.1 YlmC/YmxH family sporulation protein [Halobacillus litoralis]RDY69184.1 YlmC/YmxH family sporulation protein [Halobacillus trueperi]